MARFITYSIVILLCFLCSFNVEAQYVCDFEYKVMNKQRRKIKRKCKKTAMAWYKAHIDSLPFPADMEFSKVKYLADDDEFEKWQIIDTLLCNNERKQNVDIAKKKMEELGLSIYDIRGFFRHPDELNPKIRSILYFQFDINGKMLRAVLRRKEMSPTSELFYH